MNVLEVLHLPSGYAIAIVDDPVDGSTKLVVIHAGEDEGVVVDFDALVTTESLHAAGPVESKRVTRELKAQLWDSETGHAVS